MKLSPETIHSNFEKFKTRIDKIFKTRSKEIHEMYSHLGEERLIFAPASSFSHFHNAFPGGYIDHVLRVMDYSMMLHKTWETAGLESSNYELEELLFAAMHHDLGKLGMPGDSGELYQVNDSEWHRKNQGKEFKKNEHIPHSTIQDRSIFLLQSYGIKMSWNEFLGIRVHDGMYDEVNKPFLFAFSLDGKLRNNLPIILHHADMMAARFEFERWAKQTGTFNLDNTPKAQVKKPTNGTTESKQNLFKDISAEFLK